MEGATSQEHDLERMIRANARLTGQLLTPAVIADTANWVAEMHKRAIPDARMTQVEMHGAQCAGQTS